MTIIKPMPGQHSCETPGSLRPKHEWPLGKSFGQTVRMPVMYDVGTIWVCDICARPWHACDTPPNPPGGPYHGGGRVWRPVRWFHFNMRRRASASSHMED